MRRVWCSVLLIFFAGTVAALAQDSARDAKPADAVPAGDVGAAVKGQAFSAVKYSRKVKNMPDGKQVILIEDNVMRVARDGDGRVRVDIAEGAPDCEGLGSVALEKCPARHVVLFDPALRNIVHWPEGQFAVRVSVVIQLNGGQVESAGDSTLTLPEQETIVDSDGAIVTTVRLPGKRVDGVMATGIRTTSVVPAGHFGNKDAITRIHEVWTSQAMQLVVKVIDGDPSGEETISGLEHVSLAPDPKLFRSPEGYEVQDRNRMGDESQYAESDMAYLARWFVR